MILEYKMDRGVNGDLVVPPWVECPGFFGDPDTNTFIGFSPSHREYKIPDSVTRMTLEEAKARSLSIHAKHPFFDIEGVKLTNQQVEDLTALIVSNNDLL